jgi:hypothetical protein
VKCNLIPSSSLNELLLQKLVSLDDEVILKIVYCVSEIA